MSIDKRRKWGIAVGAVITFSLFSSCVVLVTWPRTPPISLDSRGRSDRPDDFLESAVQSLSRANDLNACRSAIQQINNHFREHPEQKPPSLTAAEHDLLRSQVRLAEDEISEAASTSFTLLDAHHLDLCLLFRDAARSFGGEDLPPRARAAAAFAWVVRQVPLREPRGEPAPPQFVLRRGWGTPLERALVFLALLDQLGIEGCLVGSSTDISGPSGPHYWAVGALVDQDIYLFDHRLGLPLPGPAEKGIATLAQARTQLNLLQPLTVNEKYPYDVTLRQAQEAEVHLACGMSALAPRMRYLQNVLAPAGKVRLSVEPEAWLEKWRAATRGPAFTGSQVRIRNQPADPNSPLRLLRSFLSPEEGGTDKSYRKQRFELDLFPLSALPRSIRDLPGDVDPGLRLRILYRLPFMQFSLVPPKSRDVLPQPTHYALAPRSPRDHILRGRFDEAAPRLMEIRDQVRHLQAQLQAETNWDEQVAQWCDEAKSAHAKLLIAEREVALGKSPEAKRAAAQGEVQVVWKKSEKVILRLQAAAAESLGAEATYLLALSKQEQAEQSQIKLERAGGDTSETKSRAARDAADWWKTYLEEYPSAPGASAARLMRARALAALGERAEAITLLENLTGNLNNLEKTARLYQAKRLQTGNSPAHP